VAGVEALTAQAMYQSPSYQYFDVPMEVCLSVVNILLMVLLQQLLVV
jgi:hypothetical protein